MFANVRVRLKMFAWELEGTVTRTPLQKKAAALRNLAHRPAKPALNRGRIQILVQRALLTLNGTATTSQVIGWTCCRKRLLQGRRIERHDYRAARRALDRIAERIGRAKTIGRPWIFRVRAKDSR